MKRGEFIVALTSSIGALTLGIKKLKLKNERNIPSNIPMYLRKYPYTPDDVFMNAKGDWVVHPDRILK